MALQSKFYFKIGGQWVYQGTTSDTEWSVLSLDLQYAQTYEWRVDIYDTEGRLLGTGDTWSFATIFYAPPKPSGATTWDETNEHWEGTLTGENNIMTLKRVVAAANSKIWYESI